METDRVRFCGGIFVAVCLLLSACQPQPISVGVPSPLRVALLPDRSMVGKRATLILEHLGRELGVETRLIDAASYEDLIERFEAGEADIALLGGFTFALLEKRSGAVALALRDIDLRFTSVFVARPGSGARALEDLRGLTFSFGPHLSTSGHLMARRHLKESGFDPASFFGGVRYSSNHSETLAWVRDGTVDAGALNSTLLRQMIADGRLQRGQVTILCETRPYPNYVWAGASHLDASARTGIRDAFLSLSPSVPEHVKILDSLDAGYFLPADSSTFEQIADAIRTLDLGEGA